MKTINVAKEFSRYPAGRYLADGPFSGERFRDDYLKPGIENNAQLTIELDGVRGYGSSFLEEAFGGLVRTGIDPAVLRRQLMLNSSDPSLVEEILLYIEHADE